MKAELRRLHSPDVLDLALFKPENPGCFGILVQALIGPADGIGEESFDFLVCTPTWLEMQMQMSEDSAVYGRHHLLLLQYDYTILHRTIDSLCHQAYGQDWHSIAIFLSRYGRWEFEDYDT